MNVILPDGSSKEVKQGATVGDVAAAIGAGLAKAALAGVVEGHLRDVSFVVSEGEHVAIITNRSPEALDILRHSTAHVMAAAIQDLYGEVEFGIGPSVEDGFYYDIKMDKTLSPDDLENIEARMSEIVSEALPFEQAIVTRDEAEKIFADQPLKLELIAELPDTETITTYTLGTFTDLCRGPHVPDVSKVAAFKLTKLAGAYWRGNSDREMLQRVYGTAFFSSKDLKKYLHNIEEAEKRDHRKLGRELGLFMLDDQAGPGLPMYPPKGARVIRLLQEWLRRNLYKRGYEEVITPHIYKADVWKTSGHYDFYKENMYFFSINEGDEENPRLSEYGVKPMNCPGHVMLYRNELRSYRDLPLRYFEFGTVYRHELSGVVHGLLRARGFTQDDAHVFCRQDQVVSEVVSMLDLIDYVMTTFGFEYSAEISTRPEKSIGTDAMWEHAQNSLEQACEERDLEYELNEGDGAFYGPKIDIMVKDALGRTWQCSTVQVDFNFPERFELTYRSADNTEEQPWMLHRAILGSIERFLGILIEHYAGAFPLWLSPTQVAILPLADRHSEACEKLASILRDVGGRVELYDQNEPMRVKIAKAQAEKIPYMVVLGDKEVESNTISVRDRFEGDLGTWETQELIDIIQQASF